MEENTTNKSKGRLILAILLGLSVIGNGLLFYNWYQDNFKGGKSLKDENASLIALLGDANIRADSLQTKLDETLRQYESLINESILLKEDKQAIVDALEKKKIEIRQLIYRASKGDPKALLEANARVNQLEGELGNVRQEIINLKQQNNKYGNDLQDAERRTIEVEKIRDEILDEHNELVEKVKSTKFQVSEFVIEPIRLKGVKELVSYKAGKIDFIKIKFVLNENDLIEPGSKDISIRILGTHGEVLGADNHEDLMDTDKLISLKKKINYGGKSENIDFKFKQDADYKKGNHTVEILSDGVLLTRNSINLE